MPIVDNNNFRWESGVVLDVSEIQTFASTVWTKWCGKAYRKDSPYKTLLLHDPPSDDEFYNDYDERYW